MQLRAIQVRHSLKNDDKVITDKVMSLNAFFHDKNGTPTPKLSQYFVKTQKTRDVYNIKELTKYGIHSIESVSNMWLKIQKLF